jgi:predicted deacylase
MRMIKNMLAGKWASLLTTVVVLGTGYVCATHVDWWLYQLHSSRQAREVEPLLKRIHAAGLPVEPLGSLVYGKQRWPIEAVVLARARAARTACIFGGIHGNEPAGVNTALNLIEDLGRMPSLHARFNFVIVPLANPWGWMHDLRHNGDNLDIARHFSNDLTVESQLIRQLLERHKCSVLIDLHEDRLRSEFYLLTYENPDANTVRTIGPRLQTTDMPLMTNGVTHIRESDFSSTSRTTLALYARQHGVTQSWIVETPARGAMAERVALHRRAIDALLEANAQ